MATHRACLTVTRPQAHRDKKDRQTQTPDADGQDRTGQDRLGFVLE